jgi:hypothetical protein
VKKVKTLAANEIRQMWQPSLLVSEHGYSIEQIRATDAYPLILNRHYAHRLPSITHAFGLICDGDLVGVCTYGTPASSTLCRGVCGDEHQRRVLELNRLVLLRNLPNEASRLVAGSLRLLPRPSIVVSYADTSQQHLGIVYQATNFIYTGLSTQFRDPVVEGLEHQHHATYAHGLTNQQVVEKYGADRVRFVERQRKHRYVIFVGSARQRRHLRAALRYPVHPYPKDQSEPCAASRRSKTKREHRDTDDE